MLLFPIFNIEGETIMRDSKYENMHKFYGPFPARGPKVEVRSCETWDGTKRRSYTREHEYESYVKSLRSFPKSLKGR